MVEETYGIRHDLVMSNRNTLEVTGVISVESFDSEEFLLNTECGSLLNTEGTSPRRPRIADFPSTRAQAPLALTYILVSANKRQNQTKESAHGR